MAQKEESMCVIEFSYFRGIDSDFIVKELAVCSPHDRRQQIYVFTQPYPESNLSLDMRNSNMLRRNHGVHYAWDEGDIPYFRLSTILLNVSSEFSKIAAYGIEKCNFLQRITGRVVINLYPKFDEFLESKISQCLV